jgi:transketolase
MGWSPDETFVVPEDVAGFFRKAMDRGREHHQNWLERVERAGDRAAELAQFEAEVSIKLDGPAFDDSKPLATRAASGQLFEEIAEKVPNFLGGAADLVESTKTEIKSSHRFARRDRSGRNIPFGVREHAMGTITNGINAHGALRAYGATFFVFSDYMRPAVRLSALMEIPSIWVYTHESVFLGEDGPTHQPVEHLASLRAMPGLWVVRPADATETVEAWELALNRNEGPTALLFTRQNLPVLNRERGGVQRGGYVLREGDELVIVATGSEVSLALDAADLLGRSTRVVSLPCWELFFEQDEEYRQLVLGDGLPMVSIEAGATFGWERIIGKDGLAIGIDRFGASAPATALATYFGLTPQAVAERIDNWLS